MTKQKIIDAAIAVLNEDFSAPMDRIAEKAALSRRTLHRYFKDREELLNACISDMMHTWQTVMMNAYNSSDDPVKQLELMLYAGIDCGVKYAFLNKLQERIADKPVAEANKNASYETIRDKWFGKVPSLQRKGIINKQLSVAWIRALFTGMITTTIHELQAGNIAPNDIKKLAWYSFRKSIGIDT